MMQLEILEKSAYSETKMKNKIQVTITSQI